MVVSRQSVRFLSMVVLMTLIGGSAVLRGQTRDDNWKRCGGNDPDQAIGACSAIIPLIHRSPRLAMDVTVAISAERDQIFVSVVTEQASRANVMNLETIGTAAVLASPSVTLQHFGAEFAIRIWVQLKLRS
jgi:hypothetical protein